MIVALGLGISFAIGVDWRRVAVLALAIYLPFVAGGLVLLFWWRNRATSETSAALFCEATASELRAGRTLHDAVCRARASIGNGKSSEPQTDDWVTATACEFPDIEDELAHVLRSSRRAGSDVAALFDEIGALALAKSEIKREVRMATAPGKVTALVLIGAPVGYLMTQLDSNGLGRLVATAPQRVAFTVGLGLFLLGATGASFVAWRAAR